MQSVRTFEQEAAEDIFFGQAVIIWARWFLIAAATGLVMWSFDEKNSLVLGIIPVVALMAMNFYLHGRYLMEKPIGTRLLVATSAMDLLIITMLVVVWPVGVGETRFDNPFFLFYSPMVLGFAFVMPRKIEATYTVATIAVYALAMFLFVDMTFVPGHPDYSSAVALQVNLKTLAVRVIALAAVVGLGNYFWRIQRARRRAAQADGGPL